jgi:apolipoprotein N-acyltransferase
MQEVLPGEAPEPAGGQEEDALPRLRLTAPPAFPIALLVSIASGLLLSLAFPPAAVWPVAFAAAAPFLWTLRGVGPARRFLLGLAFGVAFYGATLYWVLRFGELGWTGLTLLSASSTALVGVLAPVVIRAGHPIVSATGLAALWTVVDWLRGVAPLGGFTWGSLGVSQVDNRATIRLATLAGVWGVTFVVAWVNALLVEAAVGGGGRRRRLGAVAVAVGAVLAPVAIPFASAEGRRLEVATIQIDNRPAMSLDPTAEDLEVARLNVERHRALTADPPDLVAWGEGALDPRAAADPGTMAAVRRAIADVGAPTLVGAVVNDPDGRQRTSALLFAGSGELADRYDKVHLVPFGEYVPFRDALSWIEAIDQVPVDRAPGTSLRPVAVEGSPRFGAPICYENAFPALVRAMVRAGAEFLVVTVNNASYGLTAASEQHLQMSRIRAVEDGRWVVNAAVSGISAVIDPSGRVVARAGLFEPATIRHRIRASRARTWYVRLGDWVPLISLAWVVGLFVAPGRAPSTRARPLPLPPSRRRTLVVLPTYEERATIGGVVRRLLALPERVDVLVVDDSSPDGTGEVVRAIAATDPRVRLIERPRKSGLASAYLEGFRAAIADGYDLAVEMDSDLSHSPEELPRLLGAVAGSDDLTVGSRYVPGGSVTNWSPTRVWLSRAGNAYARLWLGLPIHDATSGFRVYRRGLLEHLVRERTRSDGYGFQIELVLRSARAGSTVGEVPITFRERQHGRSKISRRIIAEALWLVTVWGLRERLGRGRGIRS